MTDHLGELASDAAIAHTLQSMCLRANPATITGAATYVAQGNGGLATQASAATIPCPVYIPAGVEKLRLSSSCGVNDVAPGCTLKIGLYPMGAPSGSNGVWNPNLGAVVAGSEITFTTPGANTTPAETVNDFTAPAAGWYWIAVNASGAMTVNSVVAIPFRLERL